MIVAIDGPAGAGKSSVARALADRLGFHFLDTGAMYRAVALAGLRRGMDLADETALAELARRLEIVVRDKQVSLDGEDVSRLVRSLEVTAATRFAAGNAAVREHLVELQRRAAGTDDLVTEGRDQGTVVFPLAECKFFLTASPEERARRRTRDLEAAGETITYEDVLAQQRIRDESDAAREVGPLLPAWDAVIICTDGQTEEEVVDFLESLVRVKQARMPCGPLDEDC